MRPVHGWGMRLARGVAVLVAAGVCWAVFVTQTKVVRGRMAALAVTVSHVPGVKTKPVASRALPVSSSAVKAVKVAGRRQPAHTGIYEVGWESPSKAATSVNAGVLVQLVPTAHLAGQVLTSVRSQYTSSRTVDGDTYTVTSRFVVPGVPGSQGLVYHVTGSSGSGSGTAQVVTFRQDDVVVLALVQSTGVLKSTGAAVALARSEADRVARNAPGLSLAVTSRPLGWSLALAGGAVVVAAGVTVLPEWLADLPGRRRRRREERARRRGEEERRARGRRAVRRHRPPAWQRQSRAPARSRR